MKTKYTILLFLLLSIGVTYLYVALSTTVELHPQLDDALQSIGIIVAFIASVIALSAADPEQKKIKADVVFDNMSHDNFFSKAEFSPALIQGYTKYPDTFSSYRVNLKLRNRSGFTLKRPTITFTLPADRQIPKQKARGELLFTEREFRSNFYTSFRGIQVLTADDTIILSSSILPFWNDEQELLIWVRMSIINPVNDHIRLDISVNSENAEGITKILEI